MGLFDRGKPTFKGGIEGTAVILESEAHPGTYSTASDSFTMFVDFNRRGTRPYRFKLEVRVPDRDPYEIEGVFKVPRKTENTGLLESASALQAGIELPVRINPDDGDEVAIDWDAYMATPGRKDAHRAAGASRQHQLMREQLERNPKQMAKLQAQNRGVVQAWAGAVKAGNLSREDFEASVKMEVDSGRMDPADADAARRSLDGP